MTSSINSFNSPIQQPNPYQTESIKADKQHAEQVQNQNTQQIQNEQLTQNLQQTHGHGGGHATHAANQNYRNQFRHLNSPNETARQQQILADLERKERLKQAFEINKKIITKSEKMEKKNISKREERDKQKKQKKRDNDNSDS